MKFQSLTLLAATVTASAHSYYPACKPQGYSTNLSKKDAQRCYQSIAQKGLRVATCEPPARTITSTKFVHPEVIITKTVKPCPLTAKVTTTITKTGKPVTQPTITLTATSTEVVTTTSTDTSTSTDISTVTTTDTTAVTIITTDTSTSTSTTTIPYTPVTTCDAPSKRGLAFGRGAKQQLPASCSGLLTATAPAPVKTATVTRTLPAFTFTRYTTGAPTTTTRTITVTKYAAGVTLAAPETTLTVTTSITQTEHATSTSTDSQTSTAHVTSTDTLTQTSTLTTTATATATAGACENVAALKVSNGRSLSGPNAVLGARGDANGADAAQFCCENCFMNADCVYFRLGNNICDYFYTQRNVVNPCTSDSCRRGLTPLVVGPADGHDYYIGECAGPQVGL